LEQILPTLEIILQRAGQQRLAEPSGTAQKYIVFLYQLINQVGLIYINATFGAQFLKVLYAYGVFTFLFHIRSLWDS